MSEQKKSIQEALGAHQPCPKQTHVLLREENDQATEAPAAMAKGKTEDEEDMDRKLPPPHSIFDVGNKTLTASSVGVDHIPVDSLQTSSGERAKGGMTKDPRPATLPRAKKPGAVSAGVVSAATSDKGAHRRKVPRPIQRPEAISPVVVSIGMADGQRRKDPRPTRLSRGVASPGMAAARERQKDRRPMESSFGGTASADTAASWIRRKDPRPAPRRTPGVPESFNDEPTPSRDSTDDSASQTTFATEGAASARANSAAASASSTGARTRITEGPEVYPPTELAPAHSYGKNPPKGTSDVAVLPQAPANHPSQMDSEEDEAIDHTSQDASVPGDSRIAGSANLEVYPPTPRQAPSDNVKSEGQVKRTATKPAGGNIGPWPEEVPIEDPCGHHGHANESCVLSTGKERNRATKGAVTNTDEIRNQADDDQASSAETEDVTDIFSDEPVSDLSSPAPQITPGAVAVPGVHSDNVVIENADPEPEQPGEGRAPDIALNDEAVDDPRHVTLQTSIGAYLVNERGHETGNRRNTPAEELVRDHLFSNALLVNSYTVHDHSENRDADVTSHKCSPRAYSRRSWAKLALFVAIIVAATTLVGVLIPQESTTSSQEGVQESRLSAAPSSITTSFPSLLPSLTPTFDPETLRFQTIQSILVPISGLEVLLDTATPQYRALEWVSLVDPLRVPYKTEAERKRVIQRYVLAVLYYACGGQHWRRRSHFLEGIHECDWWSWFESDGKVGARGALCTKGRKSGVGYLYLKYNNFTGTLPAELQYLTGLEVLDLSGNEIGGPTPGFLVNMTSLKELDLRANSLTGSIPKSLGNLTNLQILSLSDNMLNGTIPSELGWLSRVERLWLSGKRCRQRKPSGPRIMDREKKSDTCQNGLTGTIPESFGNITSLKNLVLSFNMLNGTIPSVLGQLSSLERLRLHGNSLTGTIPESFGKLTSLWNLELSDNMLNGTIPSVLGELSSLGDLFLYSNRLTGKIPIEICRRVELSKIQDLPRGAGLLSLRVDTLTANGTEFLCECIPVEGLSGCCVVEPDFVGDGYCHPYELYYTEACKYDNGDCRAACPEGTSPVAGQNMSACCVERPDYIGDGKCNDFEAYNTEACGYDGGDCCESTCKGGYRRCDQNGYPCKDPTVVTCLDAEGLEGCCVEYLTQIGDGYCHPYAPYYTEACKYDNGDCPEACPEGTSPVAGKNMSACCVFEPDYLGNGICDDGHDDYDYDFEPYNTAACGWDGGDCLVEGLPECLGVGPFRLGDGRCDGEEPYNTEACRYDGGDCCQSTCVGWKCGKNGYDCKDPTVNLTCLYADGLEGCCVEYPSQIGDGYCHPFEPHFTEACKYDNGDCPAACPEGTSPVAGKNMSACCVEHPINIGNGNCDGKELYNTEACGYDGGDCCESTCEGWECGWNGYDCKDPTVNVTCLDADGLEGCCVEHPSQIGDGFCHPYAPYYTESCKYDNGDCAACPEGTSPVAGKNMSTCCVECPACIGNGFCHKHEPYNTAACGWDRGDCCEETCEGSDCGIRGYDCKDPTFYNR